MFDELKKQLADLEAKTTKAAASQAAAEAANAESDADSKAVQASALVVRDWLNKTFGLG